MMNTYIKMLQESLEKKIAILDKVMEHEKKEQDMLKEDSLDMEAFDKSMDEKVAAIQEIDQLDEGFEKVYDRIREEIITNKEKYASQIKRMQDMIAEITEKNASIQATESRIKAAVENYAKKQNDAYRQKRDSGEAVRSYYNNMRKLNYVGSQFMDQKK